MWKELPSLCMSRMGVVPKSIRGIQTWDEALVVLLYVHIHFLFLFYFCVTTSHRIMKLLKEVPYLIEHNSKNDNNLCPIKLLKICSYHIFFFNLLHLLKKLVEICSHPWHKNLKTQNSIWRWGTFVQFPNILELDIIPSKPTLYVELRSETLLRT